MALATVTGPMNQIAFSTLFATHHPSPSLTLSHTQLISRNPRKAPSMALTTATGPMKFLGPHLSPQMATPFASRSLRTAALPTSDSDVESDSESDDDFSSKRCSIPKDCPLVNRFLRGGLVLPYNVEEDDEAKYARVDMPGIGKEELKVWIEKSALMIRGGDDKDTARRSYCGSIELAEGMFALDQIKAELKNGVLLLIIPKVKLEDRNDILYVKVH